MDINNALRKNYVCRMRRIIQFHSEKFTVTGKARFQRPNEHLFLPVSQFSENTGRRSDATTKREEHAIQDVSQYCRPPASWHV